MQKDEGTSFKLHPKKFALWLFLVSVFILFMAFTSAYVVKQSDGYWMDFDLPKMFDYTSIVIVLSSVTMHMAYIFAKRNDLLKLRLSLFGTFLLGLAFLVGQWLAWGELVAVGAHWVGNVSGSFIYVMTGVHGFHLISAIIFLTVVVVAAFRYQVHSKSLDQIEMCTTYWHFLGGLWLYLYLFLNLNH